MRRIVQKKICMIGAYGVGKTSLVRRFVESLFDERYHTTIGVKIDKKCIDIDDAELTLMIWDLAGEDEVEQVKLSHLRGSSGYILVADGCRAATLECALELKRSIGEIAGPIPCVLALNKTDLVDQWEVDLSLIDGSALDGCPVFRTSARTGEAVEEMFLTLGTEMLKRV
jgi:small GTP-binding protein